MANNTTNITCINSCNESSDGNKEYVYVILTAIMAGLSIFGGTCVCIIYIVFKDLRTPGRQLLFYLAFSDALLAFGNLLGIIWFLYGDSPLINRSEVYCDFQSAMTIFFSMVSFSWTVIMGTTLFSTVVLNNQNFTLKYMRLFHVIAWIPGGIITLIAISLGVLGTDTTLDQASWCWIDPRVPNALFWQFATGKFFEIICYIATVVLYSVIKIFLARQTKKVIGKTKKRSKRDVIAEANKKLTFVPLVFIVCRIWGTLRFLIGNFGQDIVNEPYVTWINPLQGIGDSAQGFANFVIYCFSTESIRQRMFPWRRNRVHISETSGYDSKTKDSKFTGHSIFPLSTDDRAGVSQTTQVDTKNVDKSVNKPIFSDSNTENNVVFATGCSKYSTNKVELCPVESTANTNTASDLINDKFVNRTDDSKLDIIKCDETTVVQLFKSENDECISNSSVSKNDQVDTVATINENINVGFRKGNSARTPETKTNENMDKKGNKTCISGNQDLSDDTGGVYLGTEESSGFYLGKDESGGVYLGMEKTRSNYSDGEKGCVDLGGDDLGGVYMGTEETGGVYLGGDDSGGVYAGTEEAGGCDLGGDDLGGVYMGTEEAGGVDFDEDEAGGVYLGTKKTGSVVNFGSQEPGCKTGVIVTITPPQISKDVQDAARGITKINKHTSSSKSMDKTRNMSVTVDLHNTAEHGLTRISD